MAAIPVTVDNFDRAETNRMFSDLAGVAGGVNRFHHVRVPTPIDQQTVIRMNRDTLSSIAVVDLAESATLTIPDAGERYLSVMVVNQDHYINKVFHEPGRHRLSEADFGTRYVAVAARVLMDPSDPADIAAANAIQDRLELVAGSAEPFVMPDYDQESFSGIRAALLELLRIGGLGDAASFGTKAEVDPVHHLMGTAGGWGGLPDSEARYLVVQPKQPVGEYRLEVGEVPVDAFWSISIYNDAGFFEPNDRGAYSVNSVTAEKNEDGTTTVSFGGCGDARPNCLPITEGWSYVVRLYRPRPEILDGSWSFPSWQPA